MVVAPAEQSLVQAVAWDAPRQDAASVPPAARRQPGGGPAGPAAPRMRRFVLQLLLRSLRRSVTRWNERCCLTRSLLLSGLGAPGPKTRPNDHRRDFRGERGGQPPPPAGRGRAAGPPGPPPRPRPPRRSPRTASRASPSRTFPFETEDDAGSSAVREARRLSPLGATPGPGAAGAAQPGSPAPRPPSPRRPPGPPGPPLTRGLPGVDPVGVGDAGDGEDIGGEEEAS